MRILPVTQNVAFATARVSSGAAQRVGNAARSQTSTARAEEVSSAQSANDKTSGTNAARPNSAENQSTITKNDESTQFLQLSTEEQKVVDELEQRDTEVRRHEQAHLSAAGPYASGGPTFTYQKGPDGRTYATGGEVPIDTSPVSDDPQATILKAQTIRRAALSPAEPSAQDRAVAAEATKLEAESRKQLVEQQERESAPEEERSVADSEFRRLGAIVDEYA